MDEVEQRAEKILAPYRKEIIEIFGSDPIKNPYYRTLLQAVVVQARSPRAVLDDMQHLRRP